MKKILWSSVAAIALAAGSAAAADLPVKAPLYEPPPIAWNWTGFYLGIHAGGGFGWTSFSNPFGSSIYGDKVRTPAFLGGGQVGYNWQATILPLILGLEADLSALDAVGTNTCLAYSGLYISANCRVRQDATTTLAARLGYAVGPGGHTLFYLKGGLAGVHTKIDIAANSTHPPQVTSQNGWQWGGMVGAGVEQALTPAWSLKLEYAYLGFGGRSLATPPSHVQHVYGGDYFATTGSTTDATQQLHQVKLGLNYRLGIDPWRGWPLTPVTYAGKGLLKAPPAIGVIPGWEVEAGARYWYSWGRFQKDLSEGVDPARANILKSRLVYESTANSGEFFGRIETPWSIFVKGFIGAGELASGHMNDEDWALTHKKGPIAYSNTISDPVQGKIRYATLDLGYDFFRSTEYKVGAFVGYNYYKDNKGAYGCRQIANRISDCSGDDASPSSVLGITENDTWKALRLGLSGEFMLVPGLKIAADAAYLPYVKFDGLDIHHQRTDVANQNSPETGRGRGVQLETILSYDITSAFNVGVGGRYWAMWTNDSAYTNSFGSPCPCQTLPSKTERYGVFFQAAYKFGTAAPVVAKY